MPLCLIFDYYPGFGANSTNALYAHQLAEQGHGEHLTFAYSVRLTFPKLPHSLLMPPLFFAVALAWIIVGPPG